ncbi:hypothetical protein [Streptomyces longwoodensis]|uniref:hypothetical protein n=1 Tax=Streptomyces longwoodensis TaxID=68231 RepID=UPI00224EBF09|nr:hypothetical protein [Streptomyces longwoodensis]MCX5001003.1 hypothetical protein [Streptomyces longwoodensis]
MRMLRRVGLIAVVAAAGVVLSACGGSDGGGEGGGSPAPSLSMSAEPVVGPRDALEDFQRAGYSGCSDGPSCQTLVTRELAAADGVRAAMQAKNPTLYAVPIGLVDEANRRADHFGRDNLSAKGNMALVRQPLLQMERWFGEHPEG